MTSRLSRRLGWALFALVLVVAVSLEILAYWRRNHLDLAFTVYSEDDLATVPATHENGWNKVDWARISTLLLETSIAKGSPKVAADEATTALVRSPAAQEILASTDQAMLSKRFVEPSAVTENTYQMLEAVQRLESLQAQLAIEEGHPLKAVHSSLVRLRAWVDVASNGRSFWAQRAGFSGVKRSSSDLESACVAARGSTVESQESLPPLTPMDPANFVLAPEAPARILAAGYLLAAAQAQSFYRKYRDDTVFALLAEPDSVSHHIDACFARAQSPPGSDPGPEAISTDRSLGDLDAELVRTICEMMETAVTCSDRSQRQLPELQDRIDFSLRCVQSIAGD